MGKNRRKPIKQKGRFARFSGATAKYAVRIELAVKHTGEDKTEVKELQIPVGPVKLPRHVVNTGRGPNPERMQQYYNAVNAKSFEKPVPLRMEPEMERWLEEFKSIVKETPITNRIKLAETQEGTMWLFFSQTFWFFVDIDYIDQEIKRSRDYDSKQTAMDRLKNKRISWIERLALQRISGH